MKLITELIEFALYHNMLTEEHKRKLQDDGFYKFYEDIEEDSSSNDNGYEYDYGYDYCDYYGYEYDYYDWRDYEDEELERKYYDDYYHPAKRYGRRHHGGGGKSHKNKEAELKYLSFSELEKRVTAAFKRWDKSLEPLVLTVSFLTNHGMNAQGRDLSTWQNASNWLFEIKEQKFSEVVTKLNATQILKLTQLCSRLTWHKLLDLLTEPIRQRYGWWVNMYKELIQVSNDTLSEDAEFLKQNELFAQVYRLAAGWSKIC